MSIDGFIAKQDGNLEWLFEFDKEPKDKEETNTIFQRFYETIDTTIMGRKTYDQICREGHPNPYPEKQNYVISKTKNEQSEYVEYVSGNLHQFIIDEKEKNGKPIWLVGGGILNSYFLDNGYIDSIILDIIPVILGKGIKLFEKSNALVHTEMKLEKVDNYQSGRIQVAYTKMKLKR